MLLNTKDVTTRQLEKNASLALEERETKRQNRPINRNKSENMFVLRRAFVGAKSQ